MKDLRDAMLDAGAPRDDWNAEIPALIAAGQKRVRRRKIIATSVAAAAVAIVGTTAALAGLPGLNRADPDPVKPDRRGVYVEERLSPAEVERRCNIMLTTQDDPNGPPRRWVAGVNADGRAVPAAESVKPVENRVGREVVMAPPGERVPAEPDSMPMQSDICTIRGEAFLGFPMQNVPSPMPDASDHEATLRECSKQLGYNLGDWEMLAAARYSTFLEAIIMSANGYAVRCQLDGTGAGTDAFLDDRRYRDNDGKAVLPPDDVGPGDNRRYRDLSLSCNQQDSGTWQCDLRGIILGLPDGARVTLKSPDGSTLVDAETRQGAVLRLFPLDQQQHRLVDESLLRLHVFDEAGEEVWSGPLDAGAELVVRPG